MPTINDTTELEFQRRVHRLMVGALALAAGRRRDWVLVQAGADMRLADEVLTLLRGEDTLGDFLNQPAVVDLNLLPADENDNDATEAATPVPERIGPYIVLRRLGSGGMGDVYHARQEIPVQREVALKCIRANLSSEDRQRFLVEQGVLARLRHPNVAHFYDAGTTDGGQPYFAMELVPGEPITNYCDDHRLSITDRLRLFARVCAGVEHAHRQQILHRDLKPSNVLVVDDGANAMPKVIDFGIAKSLDRAETELAHDTGALILGTPAYMSPEALQPRQVEGGIDTRADVYSLGVLLYELLAGRTPFDNDDSGLIGLIRRIASGDTPTPSQCLAKLSAGEASAEAQRRGSAVRHLVKTVHGDLDWIVSKAMAPERERRYGSVGEFASDIKRYLAHEPVEARPPSARYRLRMFVRRHRAGVLACGIALAGLLLGLVGLGYGMYKARRQAATAQLALAESREVSNFLIGLFDASRPGSKPARQISAADLLDRGARKLDTQLVDQPRARARFLRAIGDVYVQIGHYDQAAQIFTQAKAQLDAESPVDVPAQRALERSEGVLAYHRGEWKKAEKLLRAGTQGLTPADDPAAWALAVNNLGVALYKQGRMDDALTEFRRALRVRERRLPSDQARIDQSRSAIAAIQLAEGHAADAVKLFEKVLADRRARLGPNHAYLALTLRNLALAHEKLNQTDEAEKELRQAIHIQENALGPESPDLASTLATLGDLLRDYGHAKQAEAPMRRALAIRRTALGTDSIATARTIFSLGRVLNSLGKTEEAAKLWTESLAIRQRLGEPESSLEFPRVHLALLAIDRGQFDQARPSLKHAIDVWQRSYGADNVNLSWPLLGLARIALAQGKPEQAEQLSKQALDMRLEAYGPGNVDITEAREIHDRTVQALSGKP